MIRRHLSIRWRLTAWYAAALTAALVLFGVLLWVSVERRLMSEVAEDLAGRSARFEAFFREESAEKSSAALLDELQEFCAALPPGSVVELRGGDGLDFRYPAAAVFPRNARVLRRDFTGPKGAKYEILTGESLKSARHLLALLRFQLFAVTPLVIAIACLGGWWLSRRAMKPLDEMARAAEAISIDSLSVRLAVTPTGDELQRFGEAFNVTLARLESAVKTLSQFVADASHELRTPLAVIRTGAELALRRARSPEAYRESLAGIALETERMTALVEDLLFLARSDASVVMPMAACNANQILEEARSQIEHLAGASSIRIRYSPAPEPGFVWGNHAALRRLFIALLDNAIKHSPHGGMIDMKSEAALESISITVRDFGSGIDQADMPHIFKRFYRADKARSGGGYGLGLSIAESIARAHSASISVASAPGAGATFVVRIPALQGAAIENIEQAVGRC